MMIRKRSFSWAVIFVFLTLGIMSCRETEYRLKKVTPPVQKALKSRKARTPVLQVLKAKGVVGENNLGFVQILKSPAPAKEKDLVKAENRDRRLIYDTVVSQNHVGTGKLAKVEKAFAKTRRDRARPGDWIQNPSGKWVKV